jgi:hypothetical protein
MNQNSVSKKSGESQSSLSFRGQALSNAENGWVDCCTIITERPLENGRVRIFGPFALLLAGCRSGSFASIVTRVGAG